MTDSRSFPLLDAVVSPHAVRRRTVHSSAMQTTSTPSPKRALASALNSVQTAPVCTRRAQPRIIAARQIRFPNVTWPRGAMLIALLLLYLLAGCRGCARAAGSPSAGEHPYVRCLAGDPPSAGERKVGALTLHIEKRELRIDGLPRSRCSRRSPVRRSGRRRREPAIAALRAAKPDLVLLLGDVGDDAEDSDRHAGGAGQAARAGAGAGRRARHLGPYRRCCRARCRPADAGANHRCYRAAHASGSVAIPWCRWRGRPMATTRCPPMPAATAESDLDDVAGDV